MTAPARITQADIERAAKGVRKAGWAGARISIDLARQRIEIFVGDNAESAAKANEWDEDIGQ